MTIGITVVSSWGSSDANAYISASEADSVIPFYLPERARQPWTDASSLDKVAAILNATRQIDANNWKGVRLFWDQALEFPRTDEDEQRWPYNNYLSIINTFNIFQLRMVQDVPLACVYQAVRILRTGGGVDDKHRELQAQGVTSYSESIGRVSESYSYGRPGMTLDPEALQLLRQYRGQPRVYRG